MLTLSVQVRWLDGAIEHHESDLAGLGAMLERLRTDPRLEKVSFGTADGERLILRGDGTWEHRTAASILATVMRESRPTG